MIVYCFIAWLVLSIVAWWRENQTMTDSLNLIAIVALVVLYFSGRFYMATPPPWG